VSKSISYPNPPLALAVIEIRHPRTGYLSRGDVAALKQSLLKLTPLQKEENVTEFQMVLQPNIPMGANSAQTTNHRFLTRDRQTSITFGADVIVVETTAYKGWTDIKEFASAAITARQAASPVDGVERVGLRFIDEIRVPASFDSSGWDGWVAESLLAPKIGSDQLRPLQQQSVVQYALPTISYTLTLRYGGVNGPPVIVPGPNLLRANTPAPGAFFLIDTDAAWAPVEGQAVPELESNFVIDTIDRLHEPIAQVFEELITEKLRNEVLNVV